MSAPSQHRFISYQLTCNDAAANHSVHLRLGVVSTGDLSTCDRFEFTFDIPMERPYWEMPTGISGAVGLASGMIQKADCSYLDQITERNLADILTAFIFETATTEDSIIFLKGPPLPKVIGRLAYRCLPRNSTIVMFTYDMPYARGLLIDGYGQHAWCGPFPSLHQESLYRTWYAMPESPESELIPVRMDIFHQDFGFDDCDDDGNDSSNRRLRSKFDKVINALISRPSHDELPIPKELELLGRSLCWSDTRLREEISRNRTKLKVTDEILTHVVDQGISALEPANIIAARKSMGSEYRKELLFEQLQRDVEAQGNIVDGLSAFLSRGPRR